MARKVRLSLANKCQLLFGLAVVLILTAALSVAWTRMRDLVHKGQEEKARQLANAWLGDVIKLQHAFDPANYPSTVDIPDAELGMSMALVEVDDFDVVAKGDPFLARAIEQFQLRPEGVDMFQPVQDKEGNKYYRYARAIRKSQLPRARSDMSLFPGVPGIDLGPDLSAGIDTTALADPVEIVLLINHRADEAQTQLMLNGIYIAGAGLLAVVLAIGVFWFITTRLILEPVRVLKDTAEKVAEGDVDIRSDINTGDEFEHLSQTFNHMLERIRQNQSQLRKVNKGLDLKLDELAQANVSLWEANKMKGEFLANVSHELKTPLTSIVGFGEVLRDSFDGRDDALGDKQRRYASNIVTSSKQLISLITDLLDIAKIEAGRMELRPEDVAVGDTAEGLLSLMRPLAEQRSVELLLRVEPGVPIIRSDPGKLHQIGFNLLSNAVKFTPNGGHVTLTVGHVRDDLSGRPYVRLSVTDTGPGISEADQQRIFEKFTQLDPSETREHGGTGLGLTISRQLAELLHGRIEVDSEVGKGATFTLILPTTLEPVGKPLMPTATDDATPTPQTTTVA